MCSKRKFKWVVTKSYCIWTKIRFIGHWWVRVLLLPQSVQSFSVCLLTEDCIHSVSAFLIHISSIIIAFVTIAVFLCIEPSDDETSKFTTSRVFAALALFNQLTVPLFIFPITIPIIISAIVSTRRLEQFLRQPEVHKEFEGIRKIARVMSRSEASLDAFEIDDDGDNGNGGAGGDGDGDGDGGGGRCSGVGDGPIMCDYQHSPDHLSDVAFNIGFESTTNVEYFTQESVLTENDNRNEFGKRRTTPTNSSVKLKKNNQISIRSKLDRNRPRQKSLSSNSKEIQPELSNDLVVSVRDAVFTWDTPSTGGGNSCLRIDRLDIPRGERQAVMSWTNSCSISIKYSNEYTQYIETTIRSFALVHTHIVRTQMRLQFIIKHKIFRIHSNLSTNPICMKVRKMAIASSCADKCERECRVCSVRVCVRCVI